MRVRVGVGVRVWVIVCVRFRMEVRVRLTVRYRLRVMVGVRVWVTVRVTDTEKQTITTTSWFKGYRSGDVVCLFTRLELFEPRRLKTFASLSRGVSNNYYGGHKHTTSPLQ